MSGQTADRLRYVDIVRFTLANFIRSYKADISRFKAPGLRWPIILLIDNDEGAKPIFNTIKDCTGKRPDPLASFTHIFKNLYLVTTPIIGGAEQSVIEECFNDATKNIRLNGRIFNPANTYDAETHYGKADFAYKVVKPHADKIDFTGFKPLLDRFVNVLEAHSKNFADPGQ